MFGDVAVRLLHLMGHSGAVPGALSAENVQEALERLEAAIEADKQLSQPQESAPREDDEPAVALSHRALPLIKLLKAAAKEECNVMWGAASGDIGSRILP